MLKIFKPFIALFRLIYRIIDKIIVTPISRLIYKISDISRENSGKIERILNRPNILIYISLILAIGLFLLVDTEVITLTETDAKIIRGQKVEVSYNEEAYVVEGIPESVDITLIGSKSTIYLATQLGDHRVTLDLSDYGVGTYKVDLRYNHEGQTVDYKLDPSTITVKISEKVSEVKPLKYELLNSDKLDSKLSVNEVKLDTNEVIIKSSQEILDKVAVVKALIDESQIDLKESGDFTVENVPLVAYDQTGTKMENVEMVPANVSATVTIDSYHAVKQVNITTTGIMKNGKAIASLDSAVKEVEVYGEKSIVDAITAVEGVLDVSTLDGDKTVSVELTKPAGVRYMSATSTNVTVSIGEQAQNTVHNVTVHREGLGSDLSANVSSVDVRSTDVIVKGVSSVINDSSIVDSIYAYVDLTGLKAGTHVVEVKVKVGDSRVTAQPVKTEITVKIQPK